MTKKEYYDCTIQTYQPTLGMIRMAPADKLGWRPGPTFMSLGQLICHISSGIGEELRMLITNKYPAMEEMMAAMKLENLPSCGLEEAAQKLEKDKATLREVLDGVSERDFAQKVVSTPWGWKGKLEIMAILFREHFTNHKMQLFTYLKLLGLPVNTQTLYGA
jgi:hypothetical protein